MNYNPKVSIIMNCHNGEKFLSSSIQSVINQDYKNWELIFFDNASTDSSKKIFLEFKDSRFKYFFSKKKLNLYHARNLAIKYTTGKFISFLDTDDLWLKNKLSEQIKLIKKKRTKFVYSNYYIYKNKKIKVYTKKIMPEGIITQSLLDSYFIPILTVIFEKKLLISRKIKFDKKYNIIGDFDFFLKLSTNTNFSYLKKPLAIYRIHDFNYSKMYNQYITKEMKYWYKKKYISFKKYNLNSFLEDIIYSEIKSLIYNKNYLKAFVKFFKFPNSIKKIKLLIFFFIPRKYFAF